MKPGSASDVSRVVERLRSAGWQHAPAPAPDANLPARLEGALPDAIAWVSSFGLLSNAAETTWFLSRDDYARADADGFAWDEFEVLSRDAADDPESLAAVAAFWRSHLPILQSVDGAYVYLAVRSDGAVVCGEEPEFEETTVVADSIGHLLDRIIAEPVVPGDIIDRLFFRSAL